MRLAALTGGVVGSAGPDQIDRNAQEDDHQPRPGGLGLVKDEYQHNGQGCQDVERWYDWITEGAVGALGIRALATQHKDSEDCERVENQHGKDHVVEQIAVKIAV